MKNYFIIFTFLSFILIGCNNEPTLQKYFVENSEDTNFITFDIAPSILKIDKSKLTAEQNKAMNSFEKMNIIAFKLNDSNKAQFDIEQKKITTILKDPQYQQLMKFSKGKEGASVSFVGDEENVDEFVFYANKKENGFAVIRVLGNDMNATNIVSLMSVLQKSNINIDQLKPLQELFQNK